MKFIDLFSGIGGFRTGMEMNGHECVAFCEIDKYARQSYKAIHDTEGEEEWHDITKVTDGHIRQLIRDRGHIDCICGGFPCQSFSIAGKRGGFDDTRGTLFFEIMRIASIIRPRYLFLENVKGLFSHDGGATFETILNTLDEAGYDAEWSLLNSKDFGVPQNRERVFIIGHLRGAGGRAVFPVGGTDTKTKINIVGTTKIREDAIGQREVILGTDGLAGALTATDYKQPKRIIQYGELDIKGNDQNRRVYNPEGISPTITTMQGGGQEPKIVRPVLTPDRMEKRQNGRRFKEDGEPMFTLTSQDRHGVALSGLYTDASEGFQRPPLKGLSRTLKANKSDAAIADGFRIRKLTPLECFRLQGFTDEQFYKAKNDGVSDSQLYKQAGNSVTVNVIDAIAKKLK